MRSLTAMLQDSSQAGSIPGPYVYAIPAPATAGANSATSGWPDPTVAAAPTPSTTTVEISHATNSDGVVSNARAKPGERNNRAARRSSQPGRRRHTSAATVLHTLLRSTSGGTPSHPGAV